ncbi:MAG: hypothetical protein ACFFCS_10835 [Candidatus Hodarchaeota archaeon]
MSMRPDDLNAKINEAIRLIEEAEYLEQNDNFEKAIKKYQEGAHLLSQASFGHDQIASVYERINLLKDALMQRSIESAIEQEQNLVNVEDEAFKLIDDAEIALASENYQEAMNLYNEAIPKLKMVGYSTQHIQEKLVELRNKIGATRPPQAMKPMKRVVKPVKAVKDAKPTKPVKPAKPVKPSTPAGALAVELVSPPQPEQISSSGALPASRPEVNKFEAQAISSSVKPVSEVDAAKVKKFMDYKDTREKAEETENKAFQLIDEAKILTQNEEFEKALNLYGLIKNLLKNAGWTDDQIEPIVVQERLVREIIESAEKEEVEAVVEKPAPVEAIAESKVSAPETHAKQKLDLYLDQHERMRKFKEEQVSQKSMEVKAFELIDQARQLYKQKAINKDYIGAIMLYEEAIKLLAKVGWTDQLAYLKDEIQRLEALNESAIAQTEMMEEAQAFKEKSQEMAIKQQEEQKERLERDIHDISSILGIIGEKKKELAVEEKEQSIKQKLLEEKKYKSIIAKPGAGKSLASIKDLLFGVKDKKVDKVAEAKKKDEAFLSSMSKKFYSLKKDLKEKEVSREESVKTIVDVVHKEATASIGSKEVASSQIVDLRAKQEREMKEQALHQEKTKGDVLSMLSSIKKAQKEKEAAGAGKEDEEKTTGKKDVVGIKGLLDDIKKKQSDS